MVIISFKFFHLSHLFVFFFTLISYLSYIVFLCKFSYYSFKVWLVSWGLSETAEDLTLTEKVVATMLIFLLAMSVSINYATDKRWEWDMRYGLFTIYKTFRKFRLESKWDTTFLVVLSENFRKQRHIWKGSPVFQDGIFQTDLPSCSGFFKAIFDTSFRPVMEAVLQ